MTSKSALKRHQRSKRREKRAEDLQGIYKDSDSLQKRINQLEAKPTKTARDYHNIEKLKEKHLFLKSYEDQHDKDNKKEKIDTHVIPHVSVDLKEQSIFYDPELNPLGKQPLPNIANVSMKKYYSNKVQPNNSLRSIPLPLEPKPRFYKLKQVKQSYESYDFNH